MAELQGQMSLFDFLPDQSGFLCENTDINRISKRLEASMEKWKSKLPPVLSQKENYEVWDHVPYLGKRFMFTVHFDCPFVNIPEMYCGVGVNALCEMFDIEKLNEDFPEIETSISPSPTGVMISTMFLKKRGGKKHEC